MTTYNVSMARRGPDKVVIRGLHVSKVSKSKQSENKVALMTKICILIKNSLNAASTLLYVAFDSPCKH